MQTKAATFGTIRGLAGAARQRAPMPSRPLVTAAAHKGPHDGVMKAAIAAAAAAQIFVGGQAMALGNIKGIMPQRNRDEDNAAREALDRSENKQPAVQSRGLSAPSPSGSIKDFGDDVESAAKSAADNVTKNIPKPTANSFDTSALQVNVGLFDKVQDAAETAKDSASSTVGAAKRNVTEAQESAIGKLSEKGGAAANLTDGRLKDELENAKDKAPYIQGGPVRSTPDILNLDEPGKKIRSEFGKLTDKVKGVSGPAVWGRNLQVDVGYGASEEVKNVAPVVDQDRLAESSKKADAGDVAAEFGPGQQSAAGAPGGERPRSTESSDFRSGAADQSPAARFGAPTAAAKALSGDTV